MEDIMMNLNGKKLSIIGLLIAAQFVCILIGGSFYSRPYESQVILDTICENGRVYGNFSESDKWYYPRGHGSCRDIKSLRTYYDNDITIENQNVHTFQMPLSRNEMVLGYSRWQQNLRGVLDIDIIKEDLSEIATIFNISMDVKFGYRNKGDPDDAWKHYASRRLETYLACVNVNYGVGIYNCKAIPIFELSGLHHDYYLLNIHFVHETERNIDQRLKHFDNLSLTVIHQNGDFTKIMLGLKTVFFPIVLAILIWYWRQVRSHSKSPATFEYMLLSLGLVLFDHQTLTRSKNILATACNSTTVPHNTSEKWYYTKGKGSCDVVDMFIYDNKVQDKVHQVVYAIEISLSKDELDYSNWKENFIGILNFDIIHKSHIKIPSQSPIVFDMKVAYKDKGDDYDAWKYYTSLRGQKLLECSICNEEKHYNYDCMPVSLFDFYLSGHDYYLLNIRFPFSKNGQQIDTTLSQMTDLWLKVIDRSGNFTKYLIALKAIFFGLVSIIVTWYWKRMKSSS
ncbi:hypothetical protein PV326_012222, partial [Microctonus aethiopoides]